MRSSQVSAICLCAICLVLQGCAAGWNHTSDSALERNFRQNQAEFEELLAEVQEDSRLQTLQPPILLYGGHRAWVVGDDFSEVERLGMPGGRWIHYKKELRKLNLRGVLKGNGEVEFRADPGSLFNGDSYKGYVYNSGPPVHVLASLDGYNISDRDKDEFGNWIVYKPLKGNWYLYLFVNS